MKMNMNVERWGNDTDRRQNGVIGGKPVQVPLYTPQISHRLAWVELGLHGERPASNHPMHGTAVFKPKVHVIFV
jgi:hypothetical protein